MTTILLTLGGLVALAGAVGGWLTWRDRGRQRSDLDRHFDGQGFRDNAEHGHTGNPY